MLSSPNPCASPRYEVHRKKKSVIDDIADIVKKRFVDRHNNRVQCGIIYCLSRNECEKVASDLSGKFKGGPRLNIQ